MIPYMEKEVALEIIKQFPVYVEFVESAIENYTQLCKTILETNKEEYEQAVYAHQYVLETFANQLEQENLTEEERREFSEKMMEEADKITELYLQQQKFHERVFKTIGGVVTLALGVTVTMLGLKAIGSDEDLPQLDDLSLMLFLNSFWLALGEILINSTSNRKKKIKWKIKKSL